MQIVVSTASRDRPSRGSSAAVLPGGAGRLRLEHPNIIPPPKAEVLDIGIQSATALARAHESGITQRDLKSENIMVRPDGYAKILDFGLTKLKKQ